MSLFVFENLLHKSHCSQTNRPIRCNYHRLLRKEEWLPQKIKEVRVEQVKKKALKQGCILSSQFDTRSLIVSELFMSQ